MLIKNITNYMYKYISYNLWLQNLQKEYPNRISCKTADFFGMWKLAFQDKMDQGTRIKELLGDLSTEDNGWYKY